MGLRLRVPIELDACHGKGTVPPLPKAGVFRSARLFRIFRVAQKCRPLLVMTCVKGHPMNGLLTIVQGDIHLFPPTVVGQYRVCNANRCFSRRRGGRSLFKRVLRRLAGRMLYGSFLVRFHGLRGPLFKCGTFEGGGCFTVG